MNKQKFADNFSTQKRVGQFLFSKIEAKLLGKYVSKFPSCIETYHLTILTIVWSALIILFGYFAIENIYWLFGISLLIFLQWFTDLFDGAIGRHRNTGLVRWGYHMDHFLDYIFLYSILISYTFLLPEISLQIVLIGIILGAFMVNGFLAFSVSNKFKISHFGIGPTEIRFSLILFNIFLIFFGTWILELVIPYVLVVSFIGLLIIVYLTQKELWKLDMGN